MKITKHSAWLGALLLSFGCGREPRGSEQPFEVIDLTSDLFHRVQSGMFSPDREPVFLRSEHPAGLAAGRHDFEFHSDFGSFWVRPDAKGNVVVYMDEQMFFSHLAVSNDLPFARSFLEWPKHPLYVAARVRRLGLAVAIGLAVCAMAGACGTWRASSERFETPVELDSLGDFLRADREAVELAIRIIGPDDEPLPHALLRMEWPEEGWMSFQSDDAGMLAMGFRPNFKTTGIVLSVDAKPIGQDLLAETYAQATTRVEGAQLWVRVSR